MSEAPAATDAALALRSRKLADVLRELRRPKVALMLVLGIASGCPRADRQYLGLSGSPTPHRLAAIALSPGWPHLFDQVRLGRAGRSIKAPIIGAWPPPQWMLISQCRRTG